MSEVSTYLKLGTTALVLAMIEDRFLAADLGRRGTGRRAARDLARPVAAGTWWRCATAAG